MYDIFYLGTNSNSKRYQQLKLKFPTIKLIETVAQAKKKALTKFYWLVPEDVLVSEDFKFDFTPDEWSQDRIHIFKNGDTYNGISLIPRKRQVSEDTAKTRNFEDIKKINIVASITAPYDYFEVETYDEYLSALDQSSDEMFWLGSPNISVSQDLINNYRISVYDEELKKQTHAYIHRANGKDYYNGLFLCSKHVPLSKREVEYRFPVNRIEHDVLGSTSVKYDIFEIDSYDEYLSALENTTTEMFWMTSRNLKANIPDIYFNFDNEYDRKQNHAFIHRVGDTDHYNGVFLCSKHAVLSKREVEYRFPVNRKEWDVVASGPVQYNVFEIDSYDEYLSALENSSTEMFWMTSRNLKANIPDIYFNFDNKYDRKQNHAFIHRVDNTDYYNGVFLCSKYSPLSKREVEYRFPVNRKEWDVVASGPIQYDQFTIDNFNDYQHALENSKTELFWAIPSNVIVDRNFNFDTYFPFSEEYDRKINHVFLNGRYKDGIVLCSKHSKMAKREWEYRFVTHKKEHNIVASNPVPFDIVFISYNEPNAEENYKRLLNRYPNAKRIHKVKGIHQAHIEAAKICNTEMFWVIDGDAVISDNFELSHQVAQWDRDTVHVWRSKNPINNLVYGYGGIKLLPTKLTIDMDISTSDMTTSITHKFKAMPAVSNITVFNTDPFNTWKSAFRECAKLASKTIRGQVNEETEERLETWCTVGEQAEFGNYALAGARAGREFGISDSNDIKLINNFDWLYEQFSNNTVE